MAIVVLPLAAAEVAMWTFALAWGVVDAVLSTRRGWIVGHGSSMIALRSALPPVLIGKLAARSLRDGENA